MTKTCGECKHHIKACHCQKFSCFAGKNDFCDEFEAREPKVITNGDKIRQMSNEELALMIVPKVMFCNGCPVKCEEKNIPLIDECPFGTDNIKNICVQRVIAYLNAPAESEGEDE